MTKNKTKNKAKAKIKTKKKADLIEMRPRYSNEVISRHDAIEKKVTVLVFDNPKYHFVLDGVAAEFWALIDGKRSLLKIIAELAQKHRMQEAFMRTKTLQLVTKLRGEGLITLS